MSLESGDFGVLVHGHLARFPSGKAAKNKHVGPPPDFLVFSPSGMQERPRFAQGHSSSGMSSIRRPLAAGALSPTPRRRPTLCFLSNFGSG